MKTVTEYRTMIASLREKISAIDTKCIAENRDPTSEELGVQVQMMDKIKEYQDIVNTKVRLEGIDAELTAPGKAVTKPAPQNSSGASSEVRNRDRFGSFGEQMAAVMRAGVPGGTVDPRLRVQGAATGLNETVSSDGGFLVQQDFSSELLQQVFETGILASRCRRIPISGNANGIKIPGVDETSRASTRSGGVLAYWKDEAALKVASKPKFRMIDLQLKKLIGLCYATDELLQDAAALEGYIKMAFVEEFGFQVDDSIINGTGAGMPLGILNAGCLVSVAKETGQKAATILAENIMNMRSRLFASSRQNSVWLINQNIEPQLHSMSLAVGTGGVPVYMPAGGLSNLPYDTLYGRPVIPIEQCPTLGTVGDIILADFARGYILAEKGGIQTDMSIHVQFLYDESVFRFVLRVDGQPVRSTTLTPYKGGASDTQSHFVALATRA